MSQMKRVAALLIALVVLCTSGIGEMPMVQAEENIETGACGDNLTYTLDKTTGELVISGTETCGILVSETYRGMMTSLRL